MKHKLLFTLLFLCSLSAFAQVNNILFNAGVAYTDGAPTFNPGGKGSRIAVDLVTKKIYTHTVGTTWALYGNTLQVTTGCLPPAYVPVGFQSDFVINACDSLYMYRSGDWRHLNAGGGGGGISTVTTDATLFTVTWFDSYTTAPTSVIMTGNSSNAINLPGGRIPYVSSVGTTTFVATNAATNGLLDTTVYIFNYETLQ